MDSTTLYNESQQEVRVPQRIPGRSKVSGHVRYLSAQDAVHHDNNEAFQGIKDSKEDLEECGAPVGDG